MTELPPAAPLPETRGFFGCALGIFGMALYGVGIQLVSRGMAVRQFHAKPQAGVPIAALGCALFCASIALLWRLTMRRLLCLVLLACLLLWAVTVINEARGNNESQRLERIRSFAQFPSRGLQPALPASPLPPAQRARSQSPGALSNPGNGVEASQANEIP